MAELPKRTRRIAPVVIATVQARADGRCEAPMHVPSCSGHLDEIHHRRLRSQGGDDTVVNLIGLSDECHDWAHRNRTEARALGLILHAGDDEMDLWTKRVTDAVHHEPPKPSPSSDLRDELGLLIAGFFGEQDSPDDAADAVLASEPIGWLLELARAALEWEPSADLGRWGGPEGDFWRTVGRMPTSVRAHLEGMKP